MRNFVAGGDLDVALIDLVWIGIFAENGWLVPSETFINNADLADPALNMADFFPLVLDAFGSWNRVNHGLPFDNYSGLLFFNKSLLEAAGFDTPPATRAEVMDTYSPALTKDCKFA